MAMLVPPPPLPPGSFALQNLPLADVPKLGESSTTAPTPFVDLLSEAAKQTRDSLQRSELMSKKAAAGTADPQAVTNAVVGARAMLQQFTALLQASTKAYQEVMHMAL